MAPPTDGQVWRHCHAAVVLCLRSFSSLFVFSPITKILALTACIGALGLADDLWNLPAWTKFAAQVGVAAFAVHCGIIYPLTYNWSMNALFTVIWLVALTNAFNLLDNMDGLAAGVGIVALLNLAIIAHPPHGTLELVLLMAGVLGGFLVFNFQPAKIFMGDTGSLSIGFFLAANSIVAAGKLASTFSVVFVPGLTLFLPIFDMVLAMRHGA